MKTCSKCNIEKPESEFYKDSRNNYGIRPHCKVCVKETSKKYRENNKDKIKEYNQKYSKTRIYRYYPAYMETYRETHREKMRQISRDYYKNNIGKERARSIAKFHTRKAKSGGKLTPKTINKLIKDADNTCFWCDCDILKGELHIDHIYPISKGGKNDMFNLVVSCQNCNLRKHAKDPEVWLEEILK